jgi:hypothetical protein
MANFFKSIWNTLSKDSVLRGRLLLILMVIAILAAAMILSGPKPENHIITNPTRISKITPSPLAVVPTPEVPSPEYVQTNGVILAVGTVVLIILIGTLLEIRRDKKRS